MTDARNVRGDRWVEEGNEETWMEHELDLYLKGRKRLAEMMGVNHPETFSDDDIAVSVYMHRDAQECTLLHIYAGTTYA